jgi:hypothetical protein
MNAPEQPVIDFGAPLRALPYWKRKIVCVALLVAQGHSLWLEAQPRAADAPAHAFLLTLALFAAAVVLQELLRPRPDIEDAKPAGLGDFNFPTATEGRVVPLLFGRCKIQGPNVIWYGDLTQVALKETQKTGLWSKTTFVKGWQYQVGIQFAMCRGDDADPVTLRRVWIAEDEVYSGAVTDGQRFDIDEPDLFGGEDLGQGGIQATCDFYGGTTSQAVNAYLNDPARQQIAMTTATDTAPRYTGTCHLVVREMTSAAPAVTDKGAYLGNSTSVPAWAFEADRYSPLFTGQTGTENKIGVDCNPMSVIYEVLTNPDWGFGFPAADIDLSDTFLRASDTLIAEGNGFSMIVDKAMTAAEFLELLEDQIGGVLFLDQRTGLWSVNLAREASHTYFGWDISLVPQLSDSNVKTVSDFTRGSWEDTTNQISVQFFKRDDDYKESYALAQDMANAMIQGGGTVTSRKLVSAQKVFPGVKDSVLAGNLAWRELRGQSFPLARGKFTVNRQFWDVKVGDVVAWTTGKLGFTQLPMRVVEIDYGLLQDNKMTLMLVQDVFGFAAASYGSPAATQWVAPSVALVAYPAADQLVQEAPRALLTRSPDYLGDANISRVHCATHRQGGEATYDITQRNASGATSGSYFEAGSVVSFALLGELDVALAAGTLIPTSAITITPSDDSQATLEAAFDDGTTEADMGQSLKQLIKVGNEYMLVTSASLNGSDVDLENVYRGVLDSAQMSHSAGDKVWLIFAGSGLSDTIFPNTNNVDIELRMRSASARFTGSVTAVSQAMAQRAVRPYLPAALRYNSSGVVFTAPAMEADGSGLNGVGFDVDWWRRIYTTTDEVLSMKSDDSGVDASTEYRTTIFVDPSGGNVQAYQSTWATGSGLGTRPTQVAIVNEAAAGTEIRVRIEVRHDYSDAKETLTNLEGRYSLDHDVTPTSARSSEFYLGGDLSASVVSNSYTAAATGTFTVNIGALMNTQIQYRINGGSWVNLTGYTPNVNTTGTIAGVSTTDTIELKHLTNNAPARNFIELQNPSATNVAYGVLTDAS